MVDPVALQTNVAQYPVLIDGRRQPHQLPLHLRARLTYRRRNYLWLLVLMLPALAAVYPWVRFNSLANGAVVAAEIERLPDSGPENGPENGPDDFVRVYYVADGETIIREDWLTVQQATQVDNRVWVQYARRDPHHATLVYTDDGLRAVGPSMYEWLIPWLCYVGFLGLSALTVAVSKPPNIESARRLRSALFAGATRILPGQVMRVQLYWEGPQAMVRLHYTVEVPVGGDTILAPDDAPTTKTVHGSIAWRDSSRLTCPPIHAPLAILYLDTITHAPL